MKSSQYIDIFQKSRKSDDKAVLEGIQALKHAIRFQAEIQYVLCTDLSLLTSYLSSLAPDISEAVLKKAIEVNNETFQKLSPQPPRTKVIALAQRNKYTLDDIVPQKPIVFLEDPRDLENIGAVIRVAAAADAAAVVISGFVDIWHPAVIRGAAGLQYAIPVFVKELSEISKGRKLIALDPSGEDIQPKKLPRNVVLIFGTERYGIKKSTLETCYQIVRLPMKEGVSSLNLATSVAATLYML